jgi:hypothetical protein
LTCCSFSQPSAYHRSAVNVANITQYACLHIITFIITTIALAFILYSWQRRTVFVLVYASDRKDLPQRKVSIYQILYVYCTKTSQCGHNDTYTDRSKFIALLSLTIASLASYYNRKQLSQTSFTSCPFA